MGRALGAIAVAAPLVVTGQATAQEAGQEATGTTPQQMPSSPTEKNGIDQAEPTVPTGSHMILVSKRPIEVLARPSSSSSVLYGFPAGRPFRLIGREAGFAQIQDLKSGATGWIDETALGQSPRVPLTSEPKAARGTHKATTVSVESTHKTQVPAASVARTHKVTTGSATQGPKRPKSKTSNPQTPKRHGNLGLGRNNAQGVLY
jgi:hypothetical protein